MHRRRAAPRASPALSLLTATLAVISLVLAVLAPGAATAQAVPQRIITIRDAETEHLIRRFSTPLFRTAGVDPALARVTLIQNRAINAFVSTGNRLFIHTGLIQSAGSAGELIGVLAHETGHIAGGHLARLPEEIRAAMLRGLAGALLGGAALGIERLLEQELLAVARQDPYFRTHPLSRDRLEFIREHNAHTLARRAEGALPPGPMRLRAADLANAADNAPARSRN